jgi:hypothetical protein
MRGVGAACVVAATAVFAMSGCAPADCDAESTSVTVHAAKPGIVAVQCWSGCAAGGRELVAAATDGEWTAELAADRPASVTLAARDASGGLIFAQRFHLDWSGCPAEPSHEVLELLEPEGGTGTD